MQVDSDVNQTWRWSWNMFLSVFSCLIAVVFKSTTFHSQHGRLSKSVSSRLPSHQFSYRLCVTVRFRLRSSWTVPWTWWGVCLPSRSRRTSVTSSTWWVAVDVLAYLPALSNKVTTTLSHWRKRFMANLGKWRLWKTNEVELPWFAVTSLKPPTLFDLHWPCSQRPFHILLLLAELVEPLFSGDHLLFAAPSLLPFCFVILSVVLLLLIQPVLLSNLHTCLLGSRSADHRVWAWVHLFIPSSDLYALQFNDRETICSYRCNCVRSSPHSYFSSLFLKGCS